MASSLSKGSSRPAFPGNAGASRLPDSPFPRTLCRQYFSTNLRVKVNGLPFVHYSERKVPVNPFRIVCFFQIVSKLLTFNVFYYEEGMSLYSFFRSAILSEITLHPLTFGEAGVKYVLGMRFSHGLCLNR